MPVAKKKYGQNFLKESRYVEKIVEAMPAGPEETIEIGPGLGDLTRRVLVERPVTAIEIDRELCDYLEKEFSGEIGEKRLTLRCGDVLEIWEKQGSLAEGPFRITANLPYYVATNIILRGLEDPHCRSMLVMVQKEVARKFTARPGEKAYSALAVLAETTGTADLLFDVPPEAFDPPPKVTSAVMLLRKTGGEIEEGFKTFLRQGFSAPRKTLAKNLASHYGRDRVLSLLELLGLGASVRPHETAADLFHRLYALLNEKE